MCSEMSRDTIKNVEECIWEEGLRRFRGEHFEQAHVDAMSPEKQEKKTPSQLRSCVMKIEATKSWLTLKSHNQ